MTRNFVFDQRGARTVVSTIPVAASRIGSRAGVSVAVDL